MFATNDFAKSRLQKIKKIVDDKETDAIINMDVAFVML